MRYLFLALLCGQVFAQNAFIVPPPGIPGYDLQHAPVYIEGSIKELKWETTYKTLTMFLDDILDNVTNPSSYNWTVAAGPNTSNDSLPATYWFRLWEGYVTSGNSRFDSRLFNISTTYQVSQTGNTTAFPSSESNGMKKLGLGLGLGLGIPLLFLIGVIVGWWLRPKLKESGEAIGGTEGTRTLKSGSSALTCSNLPGQFQRHELGGDATR